LESEMGIRLLTRSGQRSRPTPAGRAIVERARRLLADAGQLRAIANADTLTGQLRIGAIATAVTGILPAILKSLAQSHPQLEIYIVPGSSVDLYKRTLDGELDAAIVVQPPFQFPKSCHWLLLRREPLLMIAPAALRISNPHALLATQPFVRYDR